MKKLHVSRGLRHSVGDHVGSTGYMLNVTGVFSYVCQMPALASCPGVGHTSYGMGEWLVVRIHGEPAALQHMSEMADSRVDHKQFPVESGILLLGWLQLLG